MEEDAALEPRDVIVMCPDIEVFAPLIQATFGAGDIVVEGDPEPAGLPDLRVRLADRSLRQTNPVLGVVARLLELAEERLTASQVIDFADREPVRRRFRLDDDALTRVEEWIADSGIRWGLDAGHRAPFKLEKLDSGTWRKGLDRLLLGVTMSEQDQRLFADVLPLDDVESGSIDLAGRFSELVERLGVAIDALSVSQTVPEWAEAIAAAADALTATSGRDSWQRGELQRLLDDVVREAAGHAGTLEPAEIRALLAERLQGRPTRANFRTGHLTICTLVPMRSVPHRVVCLLGLDDAAFPRKAPRDGDDLLLNDPHVGDRDSRTEDRQMLLDALMAATDRLIITYTGNDERTNIARPAAVPVGELLDMADRTARVDGRRVRDHVLVKHPLQPFDPRNYEPGRLVDGKPWSFDHVTLAGARALATDRPKPRAFLDAPLPGSPATVLELEDLARFLSNPVGAFLSQRLEVSVADRSTEPADALPVEVEGLDRWRIGDRMLTARLAGVSMDDAVAAEVARGELPPGSLADVTIAEVRPIVEEIVARAGQAQTASVDVRVVLDDGRRVSGTVPHVAGTVLRAVGYSRVGARQRIGAWVRLVALCAAYPDRGYEAVIVGRGPGGVKVVKLPTLSAQDARAELAILADLYDRGMCEPLPIACAPTAAYAEAVRDKRDPEDAARREWESEWNFDKEDVKPEHQLAFDGVLTFEELLARPRPRRRGLGHGGDDPVRAALPPPVGPAAGARGMTSAPPFDVCGPLPTGVTVLEASAGTGKTYTIAALAARYVAEGTPLQQLLLVTFTRIATGELSDRVRERLVAVEAGLEAFLAGADPGRDEVVQLLVQGPHDTRSRQRRANLARALADFDAATIATIHSFCQEALGSLGVAGDVERDMTVVEEIDDLLVEVVDDLYVRRFHWDEKPRITRAAGAADRARGDGAPDRGAGARERAPGHGPRDALPARVRGAGRARSAQAAGGHPHLRRPADPAGGRAGGPGGRGRRAQAAGPLPRRARRRVPGHGPGAVGDHARRVRRR